MAFTMHSHSGQFCYHAKDSLEDIVRQAITVGMTAIALTEHMPRLAVDDLYEDEPQTAAVLAQLEPTFAAFLVEAERLRGVYAVQIHVLVGVETEWIRPADYEPCIRRLAAHPAVDFLLGSVHHVAGVPIDYNAADYARATAVVAATAAATADAERSLYAAYYDDLAAMIVALRPRVVGHFDLIRLLSRDPDADPRTWPDVWARIQAGLRAARAADALLECNTSALRKGLAEPYPCRAVAEEWLRLGGRFTLSDDSHGIGQVAILYHRGLDYLQSLGVTDVYCLERQPSRDGAPPQLVERSVSLQQIRDSLRD